MTLESVLALILLACTAVWLLVAGLRFFWPEEAQL